MIGLVRGLLGRTRWLRPPACEATALRREFERALHDGPALRVSALALELGLIAVAITDPRARGKVDAVQGTVRLVLDELRDVGDALYPSVLTSAGLGPALHAVAERRGLALALEVPPDPIDAATASRVCLLLTDHLRTLRPESAVTVRVRGGRHLVLVQVVSDQRTGGSPRRHWAVVRCA
ncbi:histidine kinase [Saccharothrix isguenensis]